MPKYKANKILKVINKKKNKLKQKKTRNGSKKTALVAPRFILSSQVMKQF